MKIRVTVTKDELNQINTTQKPYANRDGTFRLYFDTLEDFVAAVAKPN